MNQKIKIEETTTEILPKRKRGRPPKNIAKTPAKTINKFSGKSLHNNEEININFDSIIKKNNPLAIVFIPFDSETSKKNFNMFLRNLSTKIVPSLFVFVANQKTLNPYSNDIVPYIKNRNFVGFDFSIDKNGFGKGLEGALNFISNETGNYGNFQNIIIINPNIVFSPGSIDLMIRRLEKTNVGILSGFYDKNFDYNKVQNNSGNTFSYRGDVKNIISPSFWGIKTNFWQLTKPDFNYKTKEYFAMDLKMKLFIKGIDSVSSKELSFFYTDPDYDSSKNSDFTEEDKKYFLSKWHFFPIINPII